MLQEIINLQNEAVCRLVAELKTNKKEITFKAPTGSGKTFMMADFINRVLEENANLVFIVSSLSKGDLARQNFEKFVEYKYNGNFLKLDSYLINSDIAGEERLYIPTNYNVYLLPRDLYKKGGRLMQGCMTAFLNDLHVNQGKTIILIKDECHIATNNLDNIANEYFFKIINFSATPRLSRGQLPDVEIKTEDAENCKLIKTITWGDDEDTIEDAISKFEEIKEDYRNLLNVNPCLIIQISNKDKADEELNNIIFPAINQHSELKWMLIVDNDKKCDTNDVFKVKRIPVVKWKDYAKINTAGIDIIIFKMVITEGWDIPRACMLYQVRNTQSKQLDEQVMGRIRRNPRLLDFETLNERAQNLAMTAWIWGIKPEEQQKICRVKLYGEAKNITDSIKVKTTKLKPLTDKVGFNLKVFLESLPPKTAPSSIFELGRSLQNAQNEIKNIVYSYASDYTKWWKAVENLPQIIDENNKFVCDYRQSMIVVKDETGKDKNVSFPLLSHYTDNGNYINIGNWVWKRLPEGIKFSFDSEAEREWADILKDLSNSDNIERQKSLMSIILCKANSGEPKNKEQFLKDIDKNDNKQTEKEVFLWGKNYVSNSEIKFEYYMGVVHASYPDFVMKDSFGRIHIFEVKSVNESANYTFDNNIYKAKIEHLEDCYINASRLTDQIFYLPILDKEVWKIRQYLKGYKKILTKEQFENFVKTKP